ncbi:hypothetical protein Pcinc_033135 [Petrolisthes cinctipes]|uniref:procollagen-proline 4-dioxygenase n=1 Tax=Petrolisthes cinctipes TaxID=88211 RepID=A0AAE1ESX4_PETCI|nr:hypothetical protein Pcinc_033135 [Petrolisthes cinctipes]
MTVSIALHQLRYRVVSLLVLLCVTWPNITLVWGTTEPGHLYSSLTHIKALFTFDQQVGEVVMLLPEHLPAASRYLESYLCVDVDRSRGVEVSGNPIHVYSVIKRLVLYWPSITSALHVYTTLELGHLVERLQKVASTVVLPTESDLRGAALALIRLQKVYRIPVGSFMAGHLANNTTSVKLHLEDCLRIAKASYEDQGYSYSITWFHYCHYLAAAAATTTTTTTNTHPSTTTTTTTDITTYIRRAEKEHNDRFQDDNENFFQERVRSYGGWRVLQESSIGPVCRGEQVTAPVSGSLSCYVSHRGSPHLLLRPLQYEQLHTDPEIIHFHNVLSQAEMQLLRNISHDELGQAMVISEDGFSNKVQIQVRVSHTSWLNSTDHPLIPRLNARFSHITGLDMQPGEGLRKAAEGLQVQNYCVGGHYRSHLDLIYKSGREEEVRQKTIMQVSKCLPVFKPGCSPLYLPGDRIATFMVYLSDVSAGGRTGFPKAGVSVVPEAGSAVFWYNLKRNGEVNWNTQHCGCPVLLGNKWGEF